MSLDSRTLLMRGPDFPAREAVGGVQEDEVPSTLWSEAEVGLQDQRRRVCEDRKM